MPASAAVRAPARTSSVATPEPRASGVTHRPKSWAAVGLVLARDADARDAEGRAVALGEQPDRALHPGAPEVLGLGLLVVVRRDERVG